MFKSRRLKSINKTRRLWKLLDGDTYLLTIITLEKANSEQGNLLKSLFLFTAKQTALHYMYWFNNIMHNTFLIEINTFIQQGFNKLFKSDIKDMYDVAKHFYFK